MAAIDERIITIEPKRQPGQGCCEPVLPRLTDGAAASAAELLRALADPTRLQIIDILLQRGGMVCVCDFEGVVGLPDPRTGQRPKQPTISHHLKVLREAGLVGYEKQGLWSYYFVRAERLNDLRALVDRLR
jgi:ArsR family transcriptional regulator, arsenate/arsenite/antimonite-responsive transcriptional repressor